MRSYPRFRSPEGATPPRRPRPAMSPLRGSGGRGPRPDFPGFGAPGSTMAASGGSDPFRDRLEPRRARCGRVESDLNRLGGRIGRFLTRLPSWYDRAVGGLDCIEAAGCPILPGVHHQLSRTSRFTPQSRPLRKSSLIDAMIVIAGVATSLTEGTHLFPFWADRLGRLCGAAAAHGPDMLTALAGILEPIHGTTSEIRCGMGSSSR